MAYFTDVQSTAHSPGLYATLAARLDAWRRQRRTLRELRQLSESELNELGIGTSDFEAIVHGQTVPDRRS